MFLLLIFFITIRTLALNTLSSDFSFFKKLSKLFLSLSLFYLLTSLIVVNYLFDYYYAYALLSGVNEFDNIVQLANMNTKLFDTNSLSLFNTEVYVYPFIYVFVLITTLSIVFCLTYNYDELGSFMFYCAIIFLAGYSLFFTDSIIIFFFSYDAFNTLVFYSLQVCQN
jgi:hypothetical protein